MGEDKTALDQAWALAEKLSPEDKAVLIARLLPNSGFSIVLGNNHQIGGSLSIQINMMDKSELGGILEAIAQQIKNKGL